MLGVPFACSFSGQYGTGVVLKIFILSFRRRKNAVVSKFFYGGGLVFGWRDYATNEGFSSTSALAMSVLKSVGWERIKTFGRLPGGWQSGCNSRPDVVLCEQSISGKSLAVDRVGGDSPAGFG